MEIESVENRLGISCEAAKIALRLTPLELDFSAYSEDQKLAVKHFLDCPSCRNPGLSQIVGKELNCKEALLGLAAHPKFLAFGGQRNLYEELVVEHIWGKYKIHTNGRRGFDIFVWGSHDACQRECRLIRAMWVGIPMSTMAGDGPGGVQRTFPLIFRIFVEQHWSLASLLKIQRERIKLLVRAIKSDSARSVGYGHYNSVEELEEEIDMHIEALHSALSKT